MTTTDAPAPEASKAPSASAPARLPPWVAAAAVAVVAAAVVAVTVWGARNDGARVTIRVPEGTAARVERGEDPGLVDEVVWLQAGDRMTLVNDDVVLHQLGPLAAAPGERARVTFDDQTRIDGTTTLRPARTVTIVVRPRGAPTPTTR